MMQNEQGKTPSSLPHSGNSDESGMREVLWTPSHKHHPHEGRVGLVDRVETPGNIPGAFDPRPFGLVAKWVCQQKELFQGVTEMRSKLILFLSWYSETDF